jgi:hypothetical protein
VEAAVVAVVVVEDVAVAEAVADKKDHFKNNHHEKTNHSFHSGRDQFSMACRRMQNLESDHHKRSGIPKVLFSPYTRILSFRFYLKIIQRKHFKNDLLLYAVHLFAWHHKADKRNTFRKAHRFFSDDINRREYCNPVIYITSFQE